MQNIQQQAIRTYEANIEYFKENHPNLYQKLTTLQTAIELGQYKERYTLEYKNEGYFDVQDLHTNEWLYCENSLKYSEHIINSTDLKRTGGIFQAQKFVDFSPEMPDIIDQSKLHFHNALWATIKIIEYHKKHIFKTDDMNEISKSIFIGVGLAFHILAIIRKLSSRVIFISEQNLELFRLSLFTTNYNLISKEASLFFSIMDNELEEKKIFTEFLETGNNYNLYIKYIPFIENYELVIRRFQTYVLSQNHIMYGYSALLLRYIDSPKYIVNEYSFLNIAKRYDNSAISKKPILFLFSGPSSGKHIEWVKKNQDKFLIVTALSTCRLLYKYKINPDIIIHIDPGAEETARLFEGIEPSFFKNTTCIFGSSNDETTVAKFDKKSIYFVDQDGVYKKDFGNLTSPSVGEYTYALFLVFGCELIYLLGLDMALDSKTFSTHSELHPFAQQVATKAYDTDTDIRESIEYVRGNFDDEVPTQPVYRISIGEFERFTNLLKKDNQKIYNLSSGAFLKGSQPLLPENIPLNEYSIMDKNQLQTEIKIFLTSISSSQFREEDRFALKQEIMKATKLLQIISTHSQKKFKTSSEYLNSLAKLSWDLSDMECKTHSLLAQVYYEYFKVILSYIFDLYNCKIPTTNIKDIDTILLTQLKKIANLFINSLKAYLDEK